MNAPQPTPLDKAIIAYRENPTEANRLRLEQLGQAFVTRIYERDTIEYQRRTH